VQRHSWERGDKQFALATVGSVGVLHIVDRQVRTTFCGRTGYEMRGRTVDNPSDLLPGPPRPTHVGAICNCGHCLHNARLRSQIVARVTI
jgi:hypothetical protein